MTFMTTYQDKMRLNIKLGYLKSVFLSLIFFVTTWYVFETKFVNPAALGTVYALAHLVTVVLELPTGALADLIGRKKTILVGFLFVAAGWFYIAQAQQSIDLWIGYLINGMGNALISGADVALSFDSLKELGLEDEYIKYSAKGGLIWRTGLIIATFFGGYFYGINPRLPYILVGINTVIAAFLTIFNTEPKIDTEKFSLKSYIRQTKLGIKELTKNEYIKDFSIYYVIIASISFYFIYFLSQSFATEIGFTVTQRSWIYAGVFFIVAVVNYLLVHSRLLLRNRVYLMFPIIMTLGLVPGFWVNKLGALFCIFLSNFAGSARFSILDQYTNKEFESKYRATAISALNMIVSIVFSIISISGGKIISLYGSRGPGLMMTLLGLLTLITATPITKILLTKHKGTREELFAQPAKEYRQAFTDPIRKKDE